MNQNLDDLELFNETEAAAMLGLTRRRMQYMRHEKIGPKYVKFGALVRYTLPQLREFLQRCTVETSKTDKAA